MLTAAGAREAEYETLQTQEEKALQVQRNRKQPQRGACQLRFRSRNTGRWVVGVCADSGPPPVLHDRVRYLWLALVHRLSSGVYVFRANIKGTNREAPSRATPALGACSEAVSHRLRVVVVYTCGEGGQARDARTAQGTRGAPR